MLYAPNDSPMSELMSIRIVLARLRRAPGSSAALRARRLVVGFRRLRWPRPVHRQADAVPERIDLALDFMLTSDQIFEDRLIPLQACVRDQLHPVAARRLVGRLGDAVPDGDVRLPGHEILALRVRARALDRFVDQYAVGEVELEILPVEIEAIALVALVGARVERDGAGRCLRIL